MFSFRKFADGYSRPIRGGIKGKHRIHARDPSKIRCTDADANVFLFQNQNGFFYNLNDGSATMDATTSLNDVRESVADELADLNRQVVFLQGQADDKDRTIQSLQVRIRAPHLLSPLRITSTFLTT